MSLSIKQNILQAVRYISSPHFDERPAGVEINLIVLHGISLPPGQFSTQYVEDFFAGKKLDESIDPYFSKILNLHVSAHLLIARDGEIIQFVPFNQRAWHAGESSFAGRKSCNDFSIGIELIGADDVAYTKQQYQALNKIISLLKSVYPGITHDRIVGHSDIAPGRKTDPGHAFDWRYLREDLII